MDGPNIIVASMSVPQPRGKSKTLWQYHSRSNKHGKIACWGVLFDLLSESSLLRRHAEAGTVLLAVEQELRDFENDREKVLDLVIGRPAGEVKRPRTLGALADEWGIVLTDEQRRRLTGLPPLTEGVVGSVHVALEAKAAMTAFSKARPRLYDELHSSHQIVHAASRRALAVGLAMINASPTFVSPVLNKTPGPTPIISENDQPLEVALTKAAVERLPRRAGGDGRGYDGLAIVVVDCVNDGTPVSLVTTPPAPQPGDLAHYDSMIVRVASGYDSTFGNV